MWPLAGLMQLYYVSPLLWSTLRQGWDAAMLLPLACNVLSLALIAERRSRHLAKLLVVAVVLRTIGPELNPALVILTAYLARWRPLSQALLSGTAALLACAGEGFRGNWNQPVIVQATLLALGIVTATAVGHGIQQREKTLAAEAAREEAARRADEARLEQVRLAERERIAREMHDVVAHSVTVMLALAGGARVAWEKHPERARDALENLNEVGVMALHEIREAAQLINDNAKRSLNELRLVLGTLRDSGSAPAPPQPGIEQVPILVAEARQAGQHIGLDVQPDLAEVPSQVGRHGFHIVQESLTNARKHAPGAPVEVRVTGSRGEGLLIRVTNPLTGTSPGPGSRLGLVGLAERMELIGGRWSASERDGCCPSPIHRRSSCSPPSTPMTTCCVL